MHRPLTRPSASINCASPTRHTAARASVLTFLTLPQSSPGRPALSLLRVVSLSFSSSSLLSTPLSQNAIDLYQCTLTDKERIFEKKLKAFIQPLALL